MLLIFHMSSVYVYYREMKRMHHRFVKYRPQHLERLVLGLWPLAFHEVNCLISSGGRPKVDACTTFSDDLLTSE